jgi:flagellar hook protein FlgE
MSFLRALNSGVSGLTNTQTAMDVIGNNIANINTIGYKANTISFSDTFSQTLSNATGSYNGSGGTNAIQIGLGMSVGAVSSLFTEGNIETTSSSTDLAIDGGGFFIVNSGGSNYYTRAGSFSFDDAGELVTSSGAIVQGKLADSTGKISSGTQLQDLVIDQNLKSAAKATSEVSLTGNLNSAASLAQIALAGDVNSASAVGDTFAKNISVTDGGGTSDTLTVTLTKTADNTYDVAVTSADGTITGGTGTATFNATTGAVSSFTPSSFSFTPTDGASGMDFDLTSSGLAEASGTSSLTATYTKAESSDVTLTTYDSLGNSHSLTLTFTKTAADNQWTWTANTDSSDTASITGGKSGKISFNSDGSISTLTYDDGSNGLSVNPNNGSDSYMVDINAGTSGSLSGITQVSSDSEVSQKSQDGYTSGTMSSVAIDSTGTINATFSNGQILSLGQLMLATFNNPNGLEKVGDSMYTASQNSGTAVLSTAGTTSKIQSDALEQSNVDLSTEFTNMITAQRGFQANARVITTCDSILEEVVNLKR